MARSRNRNRDRPQSPHRANHKTIVVWALFLSKILFFPTLASFACGLTVFNAEGKTNGKYEAFGNPERVTIRGYTGDAMEPFITRDGRYLFFNNLNEPTVNTNLYYAERVDDLNFELKGEISGVNTPALEGVASMDREGNFYFVSPRSYPQTLSTIYRGRFANGRVSGVELVSGISRKKAGIVNFDVEVSADGNDLYFVDGRFQPGKGVQTADLVVAHRHGSAFERANDSSTIFKNVNTEALEYAAAISADGLELFFTRFDSSKLPMPALFRAARKSKNEPFEAPERVAAAQGFVEGPTLSPDEHSLYYHKKEATGFVIYRMTRR